MLETCPEIRNKEFPRSDDGLSIGALSEQTGIPIETIRIWERRHRVLSPLRSAGGHRRYSLDDVERVTWLAQRVASGQRISDAAAALRALGRDDAATAGETLSESLTAGALRADAAQVTHDLEAVFRLFPLIQALELVVFPSLAELSRRWMAGEPTVAAEHLLSEAVTRRLSARLMDGRSQTGSPIAIFCPSGEHHKIGALALAALVVEEGRSVAYFGANTPIGEVARLVGAGHVRHAVAVCTMPEPAIETLHYLGHHADGCDGWSVTGPAIHECAEGSLEGRSVVGPDLDSARHQLSAVGSAGAKRSRRRST